MDGLTLNTPNREPLQKSCSKNSTYSDWRVKILDIVVYM